MNKQPTIAIDPGPSLSGVVWWDGSRIEKTVQDDNMMVMRLLREADPKWFLRIECLACYGMPVGQETFETAYWIGRFIQTWIDTDPSHWVRRVLRREVKNYWCGNARAKDSNIRQAILDRFEGRDAAIGTKKSPGPLYGVTGHCWSALAIALLP